MNYLEDFILEFYTSILVNGAENDRLVFQKYRWLHPQTDTYRY